MRPRITLCLAFLLACAGCSNEASSPVVVAEGPDEPKAAAAPLAEELAIPRITRVWLSEGTISQGDILRGHVTTTTNVATLEVRLGPRSGYMKRVAFGQFEGTYRIPWIPSFLKRSYPIILIARNDAGDSSRAVVEVTVR